MSPPEEEGTRVRTYQVSYVTGLREREIELKKNEDLTKRNESLGGTTSSYEVNRELKNFLKTTALSGHPSFRPIHEHQRKAVDVFNLGFFIGYIINTAVNFDRARCLVRHLEFSQLFRSQNTADPLQLRSIEISMRLAGVLKAPIKTLGVLVYYLLLESCQSNLVENSTKYISNLNKKLQNYENKKFNHGSYGNTHATSQSTTSVRHTTASSTPVG